MPTIPPQNINKNWSTKINIFDSKFVSNTSTNVNLFLSLINQMENYGSNFIMYYS